MSSIFKMLKLSPDLEAAEVATPRGFGIQKTILATTLISPKMFIDYSIQEFQRFISEYKPKPTTHSIQIGAYKANTLVASDIHIPQELGIDNEVGVKLLNYWNQLVVDPERFLALLKPIDVALQAKMIERGLTYNEEDNPNYLVGLTGYFMPGPPRSPLKEKGRIINEVLEEFEKNHGINLNGVPIFIGGISSDIADSIISNGSVFKEDVQISRLLLHGKNSHRLGILALIASLHSSPCPDLKSTDVLKLLIHSTIKGDSGWVYLLDNFYDTLAVCEPDYDSNKLIKVANFNYSCRNPFVLNSIVLCFGNYFNLPHLMYCLRDSHWKEVEIIARRILPSNSDKPTSDAVHDIVVTALGASRLGDGDIGENFVFTLSHMERITQDKYIYVESAHKALGVCYKKEKGQKPTTEEKLRKEALLISDFRYIKFLIDSNKEIDKIVNYALKPENSHNLRLIFYNAKPDVINKILTSIDLNTISEKEVEILIRISARRGSQINIAPLIDRWNGVELLEPNAFYLIHALIDSGNQQAVELLIKKFPNKLQDRHLVDNETAEERIKRRNDGTKKWTYPTPI